MTTFRINSCCATWWPNLQLMQVAPPGGQICNLSGQLFNLCDNSRSWSQLLDPLCLWQCLVKTSPLAMLCIYTLRQYPWQRNVNDESLFRVQFRVCIDSTLRSYLCLKLAECGWLWKHVLSTVCSSRKSVPNCDTYGPLHKLIIIIWAYIPFKLYVEIILPFSSML